MSAELTIVGWTLVLAIIQIILPAMSRNRETGIEYNAGPRDEAGPPVGKTTGRLQRAQRNLLETLPLFIGAVIIAHIAGREGTLTLIGAWTYLIARLIFLPIYIMGVPFIRSVIWIASMAGLGMIIFAILAP